MRGMISLKTTEEKKSSEVCEKTPPDGQAGTPSGNKGTEGKESKSTTNKKPKSGVLQTPEVKLLQDRIGILEKQMLELQQTTMVLLGRTKNIMLHNLAEPLIRNAKARREADRRHVLDVLRLAGMPPTTAFTKYHRVGTWKGAHIAHPRPIMVVFPNTHSRDLLLSRACMVQRNTNGCVRVTPDAGLQTSTASRDAFGQGLQSRGILGVKLEKIPAIPKEESEQIEKKKQESKTPMNKVRGSPISKSTPQRNETLVQSEAKLRNRGPKKRKWRK